MTPLRQKIIQANSPKLLEEEVARLAAGGWRPIGDPFPVISAELGRATYWSQTLALDLRTGATIADTASLRLA